MTTKRLTNESDEYTKAREELLRAEIALKDEVKRIAALRAALPPGPVVDDYVFKEGPTDLDDSSGAVSEVRLSALFTKPEFPLVIDHFMYGGAQKNPCPMCSMWADGYNAAARHVAQRANFVLVAEVEIGQLRTWARTRGWRNIRLLSSAGSSFKSDFKMQDDDGAQHPGVGIFTREGDGSVRHFYTGEAGMAEGHWNGVDQLSPVWHIFDLLPEGRGDWFPSLEYSK